MMPGVLTASARSVDHSTGGDAGVLIAARMGSPCPAMGAAKGVKKASGNGLRKEEEKNDVSAISKAREAGGRQSGDNLWREKKRTADHVCAVVRLVLP